MYNTTERFIISLESSDGETIFDCEDGNDKQNRTQILASQ
jgi:hypothetical protein